MAAMDPAALAEAQANLVDAEAQRIVDAAEADSTQVELEGATAAIDDMDDAEVAARAGMATMDAAALADAAATTGGGASAMRGERDVANDEEEERDVSARMSAPAALFTFLAAAGSGWMLPSRISTSQRRFSCSSHCRRSLCERNGGPTSPLHSSAVTAPFSPTCLPARHTRTHGERAVHGEHWMRCERTACVAPMHGEWSIVRGSGACRSARPPRRR